MNKNVIIITIKKELRGIIRDKKSLLMMLVTPIMIPIFIFLFSYVYDSMMQEVPTAVYQIGVNYELTPIEQKIVDELNLEPIFYLTTDDLQNSYSSDEISAYITKENNKFTVYSNPQNSISMETASIATMYLEQYNTYLGKNYLNMLEIDLQQVYHNIEIAISKLSGNNEMVDMLIFMGIVFAMMAISLTAVYGVTDTTAGEKERGTLETFLTFPIKSKELIAGKYLAISISCIVTSMISAILVVLSIELSSTMFSIYQNASMTINIISIFLTLLIMISYSFFISGLCIAIASFSKTYKEAQSTLTPISFITMVPMFCYILDVKLGIGLASVPVISHTMLINESLTKGLTNNSILLMVIMFATTCVYSAIIIQVITKMYKSEKILFSI